MALYSGSFFSNVLGIPELSFMAVYSSEGVADTLGGMFSLLAMGFFFTCFRQTPSSSDGLPETGRPARAWCYGALALICLVMAGEEFSWGGRLVGIQSRPGAWGPDFNFASWVQPKAARLPMAMMYWAAGFFLFGVFFPRLALWSGRTAQFWARQRWPLPSLFLSRVWLGFALVSLLLTFNPSDLLSAPSDLSEAFETGMEYLIFLWSMEEYWRVRQKQGTKRSRWLIAFVTASVLGSLSLIAYDLSTRGWPATMSQRLLQQGLAAMNRQEKERSIELLRQSVEVYRLNDAAQYALGVSLDSVGRMAQAITCYENAVRIAPGSADYQVALATAYINVMSGPAIRAAIPHLDEAIRLLKKDDERYASVVSLRGSIEELRQLGDRFIEKPELRAQLDELKKREQPGSKSRR
jgi:hypothetical protein